ncbi:hypothetical protein Cni_G16250 [Canna indica]|uniref:DUF4378 domain-containing protein n=1 Tax=Canna indica TaxID=4628 RepID=A0AAQ3KIC5_9LILI|nr:hypothetical protein Cni_G16250 [Canna indica]
MTTQKPLMLKDYLELDFDSESSGAGFRCAPRRANDADTMRRLLDAELRRGGGARRLPRTRSMSALKRISAVFKLLPFASASDSSASEGGLLARSFSRRMSVSFWRKRNKPAAATAEEEESRHFDETRRSCDFPSLAVSRCSSWSQFESFGSYFLASSISSTDATDDIPCEVINDGKACLHCSPKAKTAAGDVSDVSIKVTERDDKILPECQSSEDEEEQLSPVSIMDFPSEEDDDEEDEACDLASSSFRRNVVNLERTKSQLLHKIGRFESLADLNPINLERRFASCIHDARSLSSDNDEQEQADDDSEEAIGEPERKAWVLLEQFTSSCHVGAVDASMEKLLMDFIGELSRADDSGSSLQRRLLAEEKEEALLRRGIDWVEGVRSGDAMEDYHGEATLREMDNDGWLRCCSDEREITLDFEGFLLRSLVEELVADLANEGWMSC